MIVAENWPMRGFDSLKDGVVPSKGMLGWLKDGVEGLKGMPDSIKDGTEPLMNEFAEHPSSAGPAAPASNSQAATMVYVCSVLWQTLAQSPSSST